MDAIFNLTETDLPAFKNFVRSHFHDHHILLNDQFLNWQYKVNPYNTYQDFSIKVVKYKEEILGYCGVVPVQLKMDNKEIIAGVFANLLVDEKLRGFGFGTLLVREIIKDFPVSYVNGYSEKLKKVCQKQPGWIEMGNLNRMLGIINAKQVKILANKPIDLIPLEIQENTDNKLRLVKKFNSNIDAFWNEVNSRYSITISRTEKYLNWRYSNHPLINYQIFEYTDKSKVMAFAVIRIETFTFKNQEYNVARIIDFMSHKDTEEKVVSALLSVFSQQKIDFVDYFFSGDTHFDAFSGLGFINSNSIQGSIPLLLNPVDYSRTSINWVIHTDSTKTRDNMITNHDNWYVTKGDGDQDRPNYT